MDNMFINTLIKGKNQMDAVPSLRQRALLKTAACIFDQYAIKTTYLIKFLKFYETCDPRQFKTLEWNAIESAAAEKVSRMRLPKRLKQEILELAWPMSLGILVWIEYHCVNSRLWISPPFPNKSKQFSWTWQGKIDKKRTVELIVKNEALSIKNRYRLACIYCLERDIRALWEQLPANKRKQFLKRDDRIKITEHELVYYWSNHLRKFPRSSFTLNKIFLESVMDGNVAATRYFLSQLSSRRIQNVLLDRICDIGNCTRARRTFTFPINDHDEVWCTLFSHFFKQLPYKVLLEFLQDGNFLWK